MTFEAGMAFIAFFLLCWCVLGLIPWAITAVWVRGRGALLALPLALASACAAGVLVPVLGQRDASGYFLSLGTALIGSALGSAAGIAFSRRICPVRPARARPAVPDRIGAQRPAAPPRSTESPGPTHPPATGH